MRTTVKSDWLNDLLATNGAMVSGHSKFASYLGLPSNCTCTLRFIFRYQDPESTIFVLAIETNEIGQFTPGEQLVKIVEQFRKAFSSRFVCVAFATDGDCFRFAETNEHQWRSVDGKGLAEHFCLLDSKLTVDAGTFKKINKSSNDAFQNWTRAFLTKYCVINDIDALYVEGSQVRIIFELKRVKEDLGSWEPYTDDHSNYSALKAISKQTSCKLRVLAYQETRTSEIAVHFLSVVNRQEIRGCRLMVRPEEIACYGLGKNYKSTRRRQ